MLNISQLPFKKFTRKNNPVIEYTLPDRLFLEQWIIPKGTTIKLKTTANFGFVILPSELNLPKRIFKY